MQSLCKGQLEVRACEVNRERIRSRFLVGWVCASTYGRGQLAFVVNVKMVVHAFLRRNVTGEDLTSGSM